MAQNNTFPYTKESIFQSEEFKLKLSSSIGVDWRNLGNILNIEDNYLDAIDQNNNKTDEKAYSMLTKWIQMNDNPTLTDLKKGTLEKAYLKTTQREPYKYSYKENDIDNNNFFQYEKNTEKEVLLENSSGTKQIIKTLHVNEFRERFSIYKPGSKKPTVVDDLVNDDIKTAKSMLADKTGGSKKNSFYIRPFRKKVEDQEMLKEQPRKKKNEDQEEILQDIIFKKSVFIGKNKKDKRSKTFDVYENLESKSVNQKFFDRSFSNLESSEEKLLHSNERFSVPRNKLTSVELFSKCCGEISYKIGSDWIRWGQHLGLSDSDLDNIDYNNAKCYDKARNVLKKWKEKNGLPSWEQLKNELLAFNRLDIIADIESKFADYLYSPEEIRNETMEFDLSKQAGQEFKSGQVNYYHFPLLTHVLSHTKKQNEKISEICTALKNYYQKNYKNIDEVRPLLKEPANVDLINKFVDLCIVDACSTQMDVVCSVERNKFLEKQMSYTPIPYSEIFMEEKSVILISGIAGIGKTWLLRKCLLDWSNNLIWKNVKLVFYLECRMLNEYQNISNINELLNIFYKDIMNGFKISKNTALFVIDGLDEFIYLNKLIKPNSSFKYPIVNALAEIQNYKNVVAGRLYAIDKYQSITIEHRNKLTIQIMGFNKNGINNYVENNVTEEKKEVVKTILNDSPIAKVMASVPFYLSSMCKIISDSNIIYKNSFLTMTDLYANIFLYFLQKHIIKNNGLVYQIMENENNQKYVLNICRIAFELFTENKFIFSRKEVLLFIKNFDEVEESLFGFIERVETQIGYHYQFAHLSIMEFCASIYAFNCLDSKEIISNLKLKSCLSMICGLTSKNQNSLLKFLVNLNPSKQSYDESLLLLIFSEYQLHQYDQNLFIECFYESQSSITDILKFIDEQKWRFSIDDGKTSYKTSCDIYFINHLIKSGRKLLSLHVYKSILNEEEKNLLIQCSTNVSIVSFRCPVNLEGLKPKAAIEKLEIWVSNHLITKKNFEENFLPWINLCETLNLELSSISFMEDLYNWIQLANIKKLWINYRSTDDCVVYFDSLDELRIFVTK
ncbi:uncharacterized protein LOC105846051 isoform X2 [Hydra vulgaris]|uniref:uncharacterized protein LOC105846051 isoform X2 n=1 Tax=Hydra vulgaris TaxID=6087 RepID=UPI001F5FC7DC|nr:uncharacterized protein LOC105846051 isoform X2 [Hydra vulgaris]